jgi:serine/arginine repetitive matrix protein 1
MDFTKVKVDMSKVNKDIVVDWLLSRLQKVVPDDDIVSGYAVELLKGEIEYKSIKSQLQGFLGEQASSVCRDLWKLLVSAQEDPLGIPKQLIEEKKRQLREERESRNYKGVRSEEDRKSESRSTDGGESRTEQRQHEQRRRQPHGGHIQRRSRSPSSRSDLSRQAHRTSQQHDG